MSESLDEGLRLAATALLLRDGDAGLEVLMHERPARGSFAGAWVFPGGRIEDDDWRPDAAESEAEREAAKQAAARETFEELGLRVDPNELVGVALWSPPTDVRPRYRTWFFAVRAPQGEIIPSDTEVVRVRWVRPVDLLDEHARGEVTLVVPTWVNLHLLAQRATVAEALETAAAGPFEHFETRIRDRGNWFSWFGDASFDEPEGQGPERHRLETAQLPWRYLRDAG